MYEVTLMYKCVVISRVRNWTHLSGLWMFIGLSKEESKGFLKNQEQ